MKALYAIAFCLMLSCSSYGQSCCSGGSGSPIAGGTSQGVLADQQAEVSLSFQYMNTNKFFSGSTPVDNFLDNYTSTYLYGRAAYGITSKLTMSVESGYFFNRRQVALNKKDIVENHGIGDLIIFPRYSIYTRNTEKTRTEATIGLGYKIPLGKHLDSSVVYTDANGKDYYTPMPPAVLPTTGSQDFIFYGFLYRGYPLKNFRVFTSLLYVKKGWNALGQRFGDYASIGLYAGKTFFNKLGLTLGLKGDWVDKMKYDQKINMLAIYNLDVASTGGKRLLAVPQISYSYKGLSSYILTEIPLYQYVNGTAIGSQYSFTLGVAYRFFFKKQNG